MDEDRAFISIVSIAEIGRGVALMDSGRKRDALGDWLAHDLPQRFENRIIPVDGPVALAWGDLMALAKRSGLGLASMDGLIAATAVAHQLTLATRNTQDFEGFGTEIIDPWTALSASFSSMERISEMGSASGEPMCSFGRVA